MCSRRLPAWFRNVLPEPSLPHSPSLDLSEPSEAALPSVLPRVILHVFDSFRTRFNAFSIACEYHHRPSYDPDSFLTVDQLTNTTYDLHASSSAPSPDVSPPPPPPWPWKNMGIWRLMTWMMMGSRIKSEAEVTHLVHEVRISITITSLDSMHTPRLNTLTNPRSLLETSQIAH